jgi:hypothetical protein
MTRIFLLASWVRKGRCKVNNKQPEVKRKRIALSRFRLQNRAELAEEKNGSD